MTKKICISGYYGFDNFGDETILKVLTENLKKLNDTEITVFSSNPAKTADEYNVKAVQTFNLKGIICALKDTDYLISGGGSLLQDATSIKSLLYYLFVITTAKFFKKKIIIFAQGIGPINNPFLRFLTMQILKNADNITVRDNNSLKLLEKYKIKAQKCNDPVWNLELERNTVKNTICIQLRSFEGINEDFLTKLADNINKYYQNKEIMILSLQNKLDLEVCNRFKTILSDKNPSVNAFVIENTSNNKVINDIMKAEEIIAMRYHACLIAIKAGIKLLPVSYDIKVENLAKEFNLEYIDIKDCNDINSKFENFANTNISYDLDKIKSLNFDFSNYKF